MFTMIRLRELLQSPAAFGMFCLVLSLTLSEGCARPERPTNAASSASEQKLPFYPDVEQTSAAGDSPRPEEHRKVSADPKLATGLPFQAASHARILPSGTLLTVEL